MNQRVNPRNNTATNANGPPSSKSPGIKLQPMEEMVLGGFAKRMQGTFNAQFLVTNEYEKLKSLERMKGGADVTYPFGFIEVSSFDTSAQSSYNPNYFLRKGVEVGFDSESGQGISVRCMPAVYEVEISYYTNSFLTSSSGADKLSAIAYMRRWLMAARGGYVKYTINYGRLAFGINVRLSPSIVAPKKDNYLEGEPVYIVTATATIDGWISEPITDRKGVLKEIRVETGFAVDTTQKALMTQSLGTVSYSRQGAADPTKKV